jgi:hypothetical protein
MFMERFASEKEKQREASTHVSLPLLGNGFPLQSLFSFYSIQPRPVGRSRASLGCDRTSGEPLIALFLPTHFEEGIVSKIHPELCLQCAGAS